MSLSTDVSAVKNELTKVSALEKAYHGYIKYVLAGLVAVAAVFLLFSGHLLAGGAVLLAFAVGYTFKKEFPTVVTQVNTAVSPTPKTPPTV